MKKYYCALCETSHHKLTEGCPCPECGRIFCINSIQSCIEIGSYDCPYCDTPFEKFLDLPSSLREQLPRKSRPKTTTPISDIQLSTYRGIELLSPEVMVLQELENYLARTIPLVDNIDWLGPHDFGYSRDSHRKSVIALSLDSHSMTDELELSSEEEEKLIEELKEKISADFNFGSFGKLRNLEFLCISNLNIIGEHLQRFLGKLRKLKVLDLSVNSIKTFPISLLELNNLQYLNLSNNKLQLIPNWIGELSQLRYLYLNRNKITSIPETISQLQYLEELYLVNNQLTNLTALLVDLSRLRILDTGNLGYSYHFNNLNRASRSLLEELKVKGVDINPQSNEFRLGYGGLSTAEGLKTNIRKLKLEELKLKKLRKKFFKAGDYTEEDRISNEIKKYIHFIFILELKLKGREYPKIRCALCPNGASWECLECGNALCRSCSFKSLALQEEERCPNCGIKDEYYSSEY